MNKQQKYLLKLGSEIVEICKQHDIKVFLAHGSLIGAIRHGGIIPWDDDFDVFMPYEDWVKFKAVCQDPANLPPNRVLCCPDVQESYLHVMPRYVATDTTCIHKNQSLHDDYAGQVIDIFILDPVADDQLMEYQRDIYLYYDMLVYTDAPSARVGVTEEEYLELERYKNEHGKLATAKKFEERLESHFDPNGKHYAHRWQGSATSFDRKDFQAQVWVPVGPYMMPVPSGYNGVMRASYGDEWSIMPTNANAAKHDAPTSMTIPYKEALEYYRPTHDRKEILEAMIGRKPAVLRRASTRQYLNDHWTWLRAQMLSMEVERRLESCKEEFDTAHAARDGQKLNKLLGRYVDWQINRYILGRRFAALFRRYRHPVYIEVEDNVFEALVLALMCTERIGRAAQILDARREKFKLNMTPLMEELRRDMGSFREATDSVCLGDVEHALPIAQELRAKYPTAISYWRLEVVCLDKLRAAGDESLLQTEEAVIAQALERWPYDGYFMFFQLECRAARGEDVAAQYPVAAELTTNGIVLQVIQSRYGYAPSWLRNKKWAKANGVPQWKGAEPVIPKDARPAPKPAITDQCHKVCFELLGELTAACRELGLRYVCTPDLVNTLFIQGKTPARMESMSIYMPQEDVNKLAAYLAQNMPQGRGAKGLGLDGAEPTTLEYYAAGTTGIIMKRSVACQNGHLCVYVHALAPQDAPETLMRVVRQYNEAWPSGKFEPKGKKAMLYCLPRGIKGASAKTAGKLARALASLSLDPRNGSTAQVLGKNVKVPAFDFETCQELEFAGYKLRVPADIDSYCEGNAAEVATNLSAEITFIGSAEISFEDLIAKRQLPADFDEKLVAYRELGRIDAEVKKPFWENYTQLFLAVKLKELSLKLLPKKDEIIAMQKSGDVEGLAKVLKGYKACYKKYQGKGEIFLDPQIDEALQAIL